MRITTWIASCYVGHVFASSFETSEQSKKLMLAQLQNLRNEADCGEVFDYLGPELYSSVSAALGSAIDGFATAVTDGREMESLVREASWIFREGSAEKKMKKVLAFLRLAVDAELPFSTSTEMHLSSPVRFVNFANELHAGILSAMKSLYVEIDPTIAHQIVDWLEAYPLLSERVLDGLIAARRFQASGHETFLVDSAFSSLATTMSTEFDGIRGVSSMIERASRIFVSLTKPHWKDPIFAHIYSLLERSDPGSPMRTLLTVAYRCMVTDGFRQHARVEGFAESVLNGKEHRNLESVLLRLATTIANVFSAPLSSIPSEASILAAVETAESALGIPHPRFAYLAHLAEVRLHGH